eukprot:1160729-Pelagomonas_calceolata.AAC.7
MDQGFGLAVLIEVHIHEHVKPVNCQKAHCAQHACSTEGQAVSNTMCASTVLAVHTSWSPYSHAAATCKKQRTGGVGSGLARRGGA